MSKFKFRRWQQSLQDIKPRNEEFHKQLSLWAKQQSHDLVGFRKAFTFEDTKFFGGPENSSGMKCWDMLIQARELEKFSIRTVKMNTCPKVTILITVPCHNNDAPMMTYEQWMQIIKEIVKLPKFAIVGVSCYGGIGRTGTILAILKSFLLNEDADPVQSIRDSYFRDAVEADRQIAYIEKMTHRDSYCKGSYSVGYFNPDAPGGEWQFYE